MAKTNTRSRKPNGNGAAHAVERSDIPGQVVPVLQGGGALGAYQVAAYEALHEAGIEPDWVIGTAIGAINAALIAGNPQEGSRDARRETGCPEARPRGSYVRAPAKRWTHDREL